MSGWEALVPIVKKFTGYTDEDVANLKLAAENRFRDVKAFIHGGTLSDGTQVPGQKALYDAVIRQTQETMALRAEVAKLVAESATSAMAETANPVPPVASGVPLG